jgi:hypothetical protein
MANFVAETPVESVVLNSKLPSINAPADTVTALATMLAASLKSGTGESVLPANTIVDISSPFCSAVGRAVVPRALEKMAAAPVPEEELAELYAPKLTNGRDVFAECTIVKLLVAGSLLISILDTLKFELILTTPSP